MNLKTIFSDVEGIVRFNGTLHFTTGRFVGIELPTPTGKNDGM